MSSFFVVQVRSGNEIEVKEMLHLVLERACDSSVKAIYAMETYTELIGFDEPISTLEDIEISDYLHVKRIQSLMVNLRNSYDMIRNSNNINSLDLLENYRTQLRSLTQKLKTIRKRATKFTSLLKGYILVETTYDYSVIPNELWHLIKSVPKVVSIPSKYNVPAMEVDYLFEKLDLTPQIEVEFGELLSYMDEIEQGLLEVASDGLEDDSNLYNGCGLSVNELNSAQTHSTQGEYYRDSNILNNLAAHVHAFFLHNRERVVMSLSQFQQLFYLRNNSNGSSINRKKLVNNYVALIRGIFNSREVLLYDG